MCEQWLPRVTDTDVYSTQHRSADNRELTSPYPLVTHPDEKKRTSPNLQRPLHIFKGWFRTVQNVPLSTYSLHNGGHTFMDVTLAHK